MRYALGIEYDGSRYFGWQRQKHAASVQQTLEEALGRVADHAVSLVCAGRTDTGVHARCQVAHFDSGARRSERSWILGANSNLPESISVLWVRQVDDDFHARFSAVSRAYEYVILNRWVRPAIDAGRVCWERRPLDARSMHEAAQALEGEHDFSAFRSSGCKANHAVREIKSIEVTRGGDRVYLRTVANGFLYHMVRNMAGSLLEVGRGDRPVEWVAEVLEGGDRRRAGVTAGPDGLYFVGARYAAGYGLPDEPAPYPGPEGNE